MQLLPNFIKKAFCALELHSYKTTYETSTYATAVCRWCNTEFYADKELWELPTKEEHDQTVQNN